MSHVERLGRIRQMVPDLVADEQWIDDLSEDPEVLGAIIRDVLRIGFADGTSLTRGKRAPASEEEGTRRWRQITNTDFSVIPFHDALNDLMRNNGDSLRAAAERTGISRTRLMYLRRGESEPTVADMTAIAAGYGHNPLYFHAYRVHAIASAVHLALDPHPEQSAVIAARMSL